MKKLYINIPEGVDGIKVEGLTQWDKDVLLHVQCDELPDLFELHLSCLGMTEAIRYELQKVDGVATVQLPNELLQQSKSIRAWAYEIGSEGCRTQKTIILTVEPRTKPADYVSDMDPSQKDIIEQMIERSNVIIEEAETLTGQNKAILEGLETLDALTDSTLEKQNAYIGGGSE